MKSFCKSQFPHKSVNVFFVLVIIKDKLTTCCVNTSQDDFSSTFSEINLDVLL